jgi:hypothetical protein
MRTHYPLISFTMNIEKRNRIIVVLASSQMDADVAATDIG